MSLLGKRYGRLLVVVDDGATTVGCRCDCGALKTIKRRSISQYKSCGCLKRELARQRLYKHGKAGSTEYRTWMAMLTRCYNQNDPGFLHYGGRGITVCDRWRDSFSNFYADMGDKPGAGYSIERLDVNGNYEPKNCIWATRKQQAKNRRHCYHTVRGVTKTLEEWAMITGLTKECIRGRLRLGWSAEDAITTPKIPDRKYTVNGKSHTIHEWAKIAGLSPTAMYSRIKRGLPITDKPLADRRETFTYRGVTGTLWFLAHHFGRPYVTVAQRIKRGWTIDQAMESGPVNRWHPQPQKVSNKSPD